MLGKSDEGRGGNKIVGRLCYRRRERKVIKAEREGGGRERERQRDRDQQCWMERREGVMKRRGKKRSGEKQRHAFRRLFSVVAVSAMNPPPLFNVLCSPFASRSVTVQTSSSPWMPPLNLFSDFLHLFCFHFPPMHTAPVQGKKGLLSSSRHSQPW